MPEIMKHSNDAIETILDVRSAIDLINTQLTERKSVARRKLRILQKVEDDVFTALAVPNSGELFEAPQSLSPEVEKILSSPLDGG